MAHEDARPLLLEDALLLQLEHDGRPRSGTSICIENGLIRALASRRELRARFPTARRIRCRGRVVLPGLVNAHLHPDLHILRGTLEQRGLHDWAGSPLFNAAVDRLGSPDCAEIQRISILASLAEAALAGTTCIGAYAVSDNALATTAGALAQLGLRGALVARDDTFAASPHAVQRAGFEYPVFFRLHAEETLTPAELERAAAAHAAGARIVMHAAETKRRVELANTRFGVSTVRLLDRCGLLSPRTLLSHVTHVDDGEIGLISARRAPVVFSAAAEMKLADGTPPAVPLLHAGVTAGLGTDAAVCSNATDMFLEMRAFGWQQKLRYGAQVLPAEQILLLATRGGAAALGLGAVTGRIAEGYAADLTLVDAASPRMAPLLVEREWHNVASSLVYSATASDVTDVMVAGRWIVRRRRLTMASSAGILRDLNRAAHMLHRQLTR